MRTHAQIGYATAGSKPVEHDIVSGHLGKRRLERRLTLLVACTAALVLSMTILHGYAVTRPLPDQTFAFRV